MDNLAKEVEDLKREIENLKQKRIYQQDIIPDGVKQRHLGEANRYIWTGLEADLPEGHEVTSSTVAYFCIDSNKLKIWNGTAYVSVTLS